MGRRNKKGRNITGIVVIDKPTGRSSNHVLQQVKRLFDAKKAGHTGSLDPLATGVLPICFGILRDKERADLGQAQSVVEHKRVITIEEVRRELDEMKRGAIDAEVED